MNNGIKRCDELIAAIAARIEAGGLQYAEAVILDELLELLIKVRSRATRLESGNGARSAATPPA